MSLNRKNNSPVLAVMLFCAIYPILPSYFRIAGITARLVFLAIISVTLIVTNGFKLPIIASKRYRVLVSITYIWALFLSISAFIHGSVFYGFNWLLPWIIVFPYLIKAVNTKKRFLDIIDLLIDISFIVAILAAFEEITHINVFRFFNNANLVLDESNVRMGIWRIMSFTSHPITYGLYCSLMMALVFYRINLLSTSKRRIGFLWVTYILLAFTAIFTLSRLPIITMAASQALLMWFCGYKSFFKRLLQVILIAAIAIGIIRIVFPDIFDSIMPIFVLVLAVFDDNLSTTLVSLGYGGDSSGIADRFRLYSIVGRNMSGYWIKGHGPSATINENLRNYQGYYFTKTSIEVQMLLQLFRYGIFAALLEEIRNTIQIIKSFRDKNRKYDWEGKLGFNQVCFCLFIIYFLSLFGVMQNEEGYLYFIISALYISFNVYDFNQ